LHIDYVNILRDIAIFIFGQFGLKLLVHARFWGLVGVSLGIGYWHNGSKKLECWGYQMVEKLLR